MSLLLDAAAPAEPPSTAAPPLSEFDHSDRATVEEEQQHCNRSVSPDVSNFPLIMHYDSLAQSPCEEVTLAVSCTLPEHDAPVATDPCLIADLVSQLHQAWNRVEQDLCYLEGAQELLGEQIFSTDLSSCCGICHRFISDSNLVEFASLQLQVRLATMMQANEAFAKLAHLSSSLKRFSAGPPSLSPFRRSYMMRLGALGELRAQKQQVLEQGECLGCSRVFDKPREMETFLTVMDRSASAREQQLHVHVQLC